MSFSENSLVTPHNELSIFHSADTLTLKSKKIKSLKQILLGLFFSLLFSISGLFFITQTSSEIIISGLNSVYTQFITGIIVIFLCVVIYILYFRRRIPKPKSRSIPYADNFISNIVEWIFLPSFIFDSINLLSKFSNVAHFYNFIFAFSFLYVGIGIYFLVYIYWSGTIEISISKIDDSLDIYADEIVPLFSMAPGWFKPKVFLFHKSVPNIYLAVLPYYFKMRYPFLQLKDYRLDRFSWLSLDDIKKISDDQFRLTCFILSDTTDFNKNFGFRIGLKLTLNEFNQIHNFLNEFTPISIVKIEKKSELIPIDKLDTITPLNQQNYT